MWGSYLGFLVMSDSLSPVCTSVVHFICVTDVAYFGLSYYMQTDRLAASFFDHTSRDFRDAIPWHAGQPRKESWRREAFVGWQGAFRPFRNGRKKLCLDSLACPIGSFAFFKSTSLASQKPRGAFVAWQGAGKHL